MAYDDPGPDTKFDQDACDLYTIITGILQEDAGGDLKDVEVIEITECKGVCDDNRHEFEIKAPEGSYSVVLAVKA